MRWRKVGKDVELGIYQRGRAQQCDQDRQRGDDARIASEVRTMKASMG